MGIVLKWIIIHSY